jgi:hypothetical protein
VHGLKRDAGASTHRRLTTLALVTMPGGAPDWPQQRNMEPPRRRGHQDRSRKRLCNSPFFGSSKMDFGMGRWLWQFPILLGALAVRPPSHLG